MFGINNFENKGFLWLLIMLVPMIAWYIYKNKRANPSIRLSSLRALATVSGGLRVYLRHLLFVLRVILIAFLIVAMARPQSTSTLQNVKTEGIDIIIALDISSSMLARDFEPDRLEASKSVAGGFISDRRTDRIGLVVFSGESFTQCPLTSDHAVLINMLNELETGLIEGGTAIGLGLANAVSRLRDSEAKSKVIILLTDGVNNTGEVSPLMAAEIAKSFGIKVYTIGVGTRGKAYSPVAMYPNGEFAYDYVDVEIDEETLTKIAEMTEGKYFRATDRETLKNIYEKIDTLEKSKIEVKEYNKSEEYWIFVVMAAILLLIEILLRHTVLRTIP